MFVLTQNLVQLQLVTLYVSLTQWWRYALSAQKNSSAVPAPLWRARTRVCSAGTYTLKLMFKKTRGFSGCCKYKKWTKFRNILFAKLCLYRNQYEYYEIPLSYKHLKHILWMIMDVKINLISTRVICTLALYWVCLLIVLARTVLHVNLTTLWSFFILQRIFPNRHSPTKCPP